MTTHPAVSPSLPRELTSLMSRAVRRMFFADVLRTICIAWSVGLSALLLMVLAIRLTAWDMPWLMTTLITMSTATLIAVVWSLIRMPRGAARAEAVDRRVGLRESLSTAYVMGSMGPSSGAWNKAITENAVDRARRVVLRDAIPVRTDGEIAWWPAGLAVAFVAALMFMPRMDLTGVLAAQEEAEEEQREVETVRMNVKEQETKLNEMLADAGITTVEEEALEDEQAASGNPEKPDAIRREAIRKLTKVSEQLDDVRKGEQAQSLQAMKTAMRKLKAPPPGPLAEFQNSLARGQFGQAKAQIEKLAEQLNNGSMSEKDKQALSEQLKSLSQQLGDLSEQRDAVEQALRQAGMTAEQAEQAARDPNALEKMLQDMPGIPAPQQLAMRQMVQSQQSASESMQSMAAAAQQMAQSAQQSGQSSSEGGQPQSGQGSDQMASELSGAEMAASAQAAANAAMAEAQSQLQSLGESMCEGGASAGGSSDGKSGMGKTGSWQAGENQSKGRGSGGAGRGTGTSPDALATDFVLKREKANVNTKGGPIIGETVVQGAQVRGESRAQFSTAVVTANAQAAEAIETMRVPREYHDAVRAYFGRLEAASKKDGVSKTDQVDAPADE